MKVSAIICILLIIVWGVLAILQMWFSPLSADLFIKISITFLLIGGVAVAVSVIRKEYLDEKQMKKDKFID